MKEYEKLYSVILDDMESRYSNLRIKKTKIRDLRKKSKEFKIVKNDFDFFKKLGKTLMCFEDIHLSVYYKKKKLYFKRKTIKNYDFKVTKKMIDKLSFENKTVKIKKTGKTVYIFVRSWNQSRARDLEEGRKQLEKMMKEANKVIFDVRPNGGGSSKLASEYAGLFLKKGKKSKAHKYLYTVNKAPFFEKMKFFKVLGSHGFKGKVIVLQSQNTCSSSELFLCMMREIGATLMGDVSYGGSGNPENFRYGLNLMVKIPSWITYTVKGEEIESNGIKPDIFIPSKKSIVKGKDLVLEAALKL